MKTNKHILITRPQHDAEIIAGSVQAKGFSPFIEPMLSIVPLAVKLPDLNRYDALVFTSTNAVRVLSDLTTLRDLPVYTVGDYTKETARSLGWNCVKFKRGGSKELVALLEKENLGEQRLLHLSGEHIAAPLEVKNLAIERLVVYRAEKSTVLSEACLEKLDKSSFAAILFFSKRTAETFVELLEKYKRTDAVSSIKALCIADSVVESLQDILWQDVQVAPTPDRDGLFALLDDLDPCGSLNNQGRKAG